MRPNVKDALLKKTKALPNGAASTTTDAFDLGHRSNGDHLALVELRITAPALGATPLPNAKTMTFDVIHSDASDLGSPSTLYGGVVIQTGAGGVGDVEKSAQVRLPVDVKRYVGVKATGSGSGDASGSSFTAELVF